MELVIKEATKAELKSCTEALKDSELGRRYFSNEGSAKGTLEEGLERNEISVAMTEDGQCVGFIWILPNGMFHSFAYIHIIAVKKEWRGKGVGTLLLKYAEKVCLKNRDKLFLVVGDFNPDAKRLYEKLGFRELCSIDSLYRKGITETLMIKQKEDA